MKVEIPQEVLDQLRPTVEEALLSQLNQAAKDRLIGAAISYLFKPDKEYGGDRPRSPVERMFEQAMTRVLQETVQAEMEKEGSVLRARVQQAITLGVEQFMSEALLPRQVERVAEALGRAYYERM